MTDKLTSDLIGDPNIWRMAMLISDDALDVVAYSTVEDNSMLYRHIPLDTAAADRVKALEEVVYENPLLLAGFDKVWCVVRTRRFFTLPQAVASDDVLTAEITSAVWPAGGSPGFTAITNHLEGLDTSIVMEIPRPLAGFLRRTFDNPPILHHRTPLCRYFHGKGRLGNSGRMYAHFHKGQVDIISFSRSTVALANSYRYRDPMDAIYYIMACRNMAGLDPMADELFLCGDTAVREETTPQLREYLAYVMPVIFPSAVFKTGKNALSAPFYLTILPLCE